MLLLLLHSLDARRREARHYDEKEQEGARADEDCPRGPPHFSPSSCSEQTGISLQYCVDWIVAEEEMADQSLLLSEELRDSLGCAAGEEAVMAARSKKDKKKGKGGGELLKAPPEMIEKQLYQNAKQKRKLEQLTKRKEKEARRDEFLQVLQDNEILPEHRSLLISGKELGQMYTVKNRLKMVLKRYKAGLALTEEETELLFPHGERREDLDFEDATGGEEEVVTVGGKEEGEEKVVEAAPALDMFAILGAAPSSSTATTTATATAAELGGGKGKKSNSSAARQEQAAAAALAASTGLSLALQLQQLKHNLQTAAPAPATAPPQTHTRHHEEKEKEMEKRPSEAEKREVALRRRYVPEPLDMPHAYDHAHALASQHTSSSTPSATKEKRPAALTRPAEVQASRMQLPVCAMEQEIVEAILQNDVVILCGETGSGKSTQVPQFCYENGFAVGGMMIGITQPRRVAAVTTADRVAFEMGREAKLVAHQIRHENTVTASTVVKFMTDGILLQEMEQDLLLCRYGVVIIDEAHERGVNSDVLLGMLSRSVPLRRKRHEQETALYQALSPDEQAQYEPPLPPLKLVIMSATLRINDFTSPTLFPSAPPPIIKVEARQFPITLHFSRHTETSHHSGLYLKECVKKVAQIHRRLPEGGILVFLTGKREIIHVVNKLRRLFCGGRGKSGKSGIGGRGEREDEDDEGEEEWGFGEEGGEDSASEDESLDEDDVEDDADENLLEEGEGKGGGEEEEEGKKAAMHEDAIALPLSSSSTEQSVREKMLMAAVGPLPEAEPSAESEAGAGAGAGEEGEGDTGESSSAPLASAPRSVRIVPLYAMMGAAQQREAFKTVDASLVRLIVVATNVAETSITIPNIKYVVDCGREKRRDLQSAGPEQGFSKLVSKFSVGWVSQASAEQRAGRAGRTGPGHCYRLYSAAFFNSHMATFSPPQILSVPLEDLVLKMKAIGIADILSFPFPTPPQAQALRHALILLQNVGAVARPPESGLTDMGKRINKLSVHPRLAKVLVMALRLRGEADCRELLDHALGLACILSEKSPFIRGGSGAEGEQGGEGSGEEEEKQQQQHKKARTTHLWRHKDGDALARNKALGAFSFFKGQSQSQKNQSESKLAEFCATHGLSEQVLGRAHSLRQQLTRQLLREQDVVLGSSAGRPPTPQQEKALLQLLLSGHGDCVARRAPLGAITTGSRRQRLTAYLSSNPEVHEPLYIHPHSTLYNTDPTAQLPEYVVYGQLVRNEADTLTYMECVSEVSAEWVPSVLSDCPLVHFGPFLDSPAPFYDRATDCVLGYTIPVFGACKWELAPVTLPLDYRGGGGDEEGKGGGAVAVVVGFRPVDVKFRWFARLMLENKIALSTTVSLGDVLCKENLTEQPSAITNCKPAPKIANLLRALVENRCASKARLLELVRHQKQASTRFLQEELAAFVAVEHRKKFREKWSKL